MTELAYVRAAGGAGATAEVVEAAVRQRTGVSNARIVLRTQGDGVTLEPFVASASVAALLGIPKKLDDAVGLLRALVLEARRVWDEVLIVRRREGVSEAPVRPVPWAEVDTALASEPVTLRIEDVVRRYRAEGAEVELYSPALVGGQNVIGYFAVFDVAARTDREAEALLRGSVAEDGRLVGVDSWVVQGVEAGAPPAVERVGGRAYFGG